MPFLRFAHSSLISIYVYILLNCSQAEYSWNTANWKLINQSIFAVHISVTLCDTVLCLYLALVLFWRYWWIWTKVPNMNTTNISSGDNITCLVLTCNFQVNGNVPLVINTSWSFPHSWLTTVFVTRLTRRVPLVEQDLITLPEHLSSPPFFSGVRVTQSLVLCVCFVDRCFPFWPLCCLFFDLRILITPLVSSNSS